MPKERTVAPHIMKLLEKYKGRGLRFGNIFKTFVKEGTFHNQSNIWVNLIFLLEQKKIVKVKGYTRKFYGIPLTRTDGSKYLKINQCIEDEEIDVE